MAGLQLATAQSPEQYARLLAFAGGTDVWIAGGNPGYDVGTCTSTKWNDWPCYELLEYVCQTACPVPPPPPPPSPLALHESVWDSDLDEKLWDGDLPVWYNGQQLFKPTASDCWTARQVA